MCQRNELWVTTASYRFTHNHNPCVSFFLLLCQNKISTLLPLNYIFNEKPFFHSMRKCNYRSQNRNTVVFECVFSTQNMVHKEWCV